MKYKTRGWIFSFFVSTFGCSLMQPVISSVVKGVSGRRVRRAGRGYMNKNF